MEEGKWRLLLLLSFLCHFIPRRRSHERKNVGVSSIRPPPPVKIVVVSGRLFFVLLLLLFGLCWRGGLEEQGGGGKGALPDLVTGWREEKRAAPFRSITYFFAWHERTDKIAKAHPRIVRVWMRRRRPEIAGYEKLKWRSHFRC